MAQDMSAQKVIKVYLMTSAYAPKYFPPESIQYMNTRGQDKILFASEMVGAVRGKDPQTGYDFDDTKRYVEHAPGLSPQDRKKIFSENALRAYPRLKQKLAKRVAAAAQ